MIVRRIIKNNAALAEALKDILATDGGFEDDNDELYVNMGSWTDQQGAFI